MADVDEDILLQDAFATFRGEVAPHVRPLGSATVHETVRRRKRNHTIAAVAVLALLVIGPPTAYAMVNADPHGPPIGPAASAGPSPSGASSPTPSPSASAGTPAPDGRISAADLDKATLNIPAWAPDATVAGCVSGPQKFSGGSHYIGDSMSMQMDKQFYADVDHDGAQETVVRLSCGDQSGTYQVVVFDRDATGAIRTLGQVTRQTGPVKAICDIRPGPNGSVDVRVGDLVAQHQCLVPVSPATILQWRTYSWNGTAFTQTAGPTTFPVNPKMVDLTVTAATDLVFGTPGADGMRHATLTVTVKNNGPGSVAYNLGVGVPFSVQLVPHTGCTVENYPQAVNVNCRQEALARGRTATVTLEFTADMPVDLRILSTAGASVPDGYADPNRDNDVREFKVRI